MAVSKITADSIAANAVNANSIGYTPANKAGDAFTGNTSFSQQVSILQPGDGRLVLRGASESSYRWNVDNYGANNTFRVFRENDSDASGGLVHLQIDPSGRITAPNQPAMFAQPDSNVGFATGVGSCIYGWNTSGGIRFNRGFTIGASSTSTANKVANGASTGRITVPAAGVYALYVDQRCEGKGGSGSTYGGQAYLYINGTWQIRRHITQWGDMDYSHCIIHAMLNLAANDYIEIGFGWNNAGGVGGNFNGTNDNVNWMYLTKVS